MEKVPRPRLHVAVGVTLQQQLVLEVERQALKYLHGGGERRVGRAYSIFVNGLDQVWVGVYVGRRGSFGAPAGQGAAFPPRI